jgi:TPP-dependent pyruvate/acetoin dehydrogenase alpha subunit
MDFKSPDPVLLFETLLLIRGFENRAMQLQEEGLILGPLHPCIGQEAVAAGVCSELRMDDHITSTHRGHGHCLAKGADPARMFAELLGKAEGYCQGKGGSMHIADFSRAYPPHVGRSWRGGQLFR